VVANREMESKPGQVRSQSLYLLSYPDARGNCVAFSGSVNLFATRRGQILRQMTSFLDASLPVNMPDFSCVQ